jgi:uncharacterized membrane protein YdbT with pleckstrin-like domain
MRLAPSTDTVPGSVNKYLLPHEQEVITVRKHPAVLLAPVAWAVLGIIAAALLSTTLFRHSSALTWIVWAAWGLVFLRLLWAAANWAVDYFVITSRRFIETSGLFARNVATMWMVKVTDMTFHQSFLGRIFGYGTFILESAAQDQALSNVDFIPYPEQLYLEVCDLLFPSKDDGDD